LFYDQLLHPLSGMSTMHPINPIFRRFSRVDWESRVVPRHLVTLKSSSCRDVKDLRLPCRSPLTLPYRPEANRRAAIPASSKRSYKPAVPPAIVANRCLVVAP
jgi:hypothetical protein